MPEQLSGANLARSILNDFKARARTAPTGTGPARGKSARRRRHGDDREPVTLGSIVETLTAGQATAPQAVTGLDGGHIIDQWATLCPQYAATVQPVHYDPARGRLDLRPTSHAYAAQLRLLGGQLCKQINDKLGREAVRLIRVLPVGAIAASTAVRETARPGAAPVRTRETASDGYGAALAQALAHRPELPSLPDVQAAERRQDTALRTNREPEQVHAERVALWSEDRSELPEPGSVEASLAAAIAYKRREQAGLVEPQRLFGAA